MESKFFGVQILDPFDRFEEDLMNGIEDAQVLLSDDPRDAWYQIGDGFRKWILRYISECPGQYPYHLRRNKKIHRSILHAYMNVKAKREDKE